MDSNIPRLFIIGKISSIFYRLKRLVQSQLINYRARNLEIEDGHYYADFKVKHITERCGWKKFGAPDKNTYEYWWREACGIVCLRMVVDSLSLKQSALDLTIYDHILYAIEKGCYLKFQKDGETIKIGWIHHKLASLARPYGVVGNSVKLTTNAICLAVMSNSLVVASIYRPFTRFIDEKAERKQVGGHLVVIKGFINESGSCKGFFVADPYDKENREIAVDINLFNDIYSGSSIIFKRKTL